jgi:putative acetyltransferase
MPKFKKMDLKFRQANLNDLEEMQELFVETIKNTCKNEYNKQQIDAWVSSVENKERWKSILANQYFLIAEINNKMVGFGSLENGNYLDFMYVHKDFLRKGIANLIFEKLKAKSLELGFDKLNSDVSKTARPFFENKGFKVIRENKNMMKGVEIINYHMSQ